ncbi:PTS system mannose/fructose/N-acetylgalactosamine-transporter subunit IIB [Salmonella enterica]|uniref:PTS sugar transporter subunit IIB n=1 Tax=Salmonella enterica TaxID=28901 RepID=UPI000DA2BF72|nr:PTS system mannose/fructose/N-acetylgalactosamine-transporter subunit IIB [Salmonella enterica]EBW7589092.1 PTS system mannose/fructose/N-acetylgalactosamine-transporter subunit IIB [Salmonella enterica subsp. salamae serovar Sofia]ECG1028030.1 PTS system mannose/fructose/N-acetylgalactosamine-transporter subunit IIB [Salmonella enterica subsp. salamae]HCM1951931.1 PTS system mannose/fructose/N-acetylgalactosamine-transporter subunit IIB [Salmonella enterica subsp. salamae serovar 9,46:z4,z24
MIVFLRVDHRLLHGQVAFSWTQYVGADCILIANDSVPGDDLRKTTIKMAKPPAVKLVIKNIADSIEAIKSGVTDKYKLFIVVESVADAYRLARELPDIKSINLGGTKVREGSQNIAKAINLLADEMAQLRELAAGGVEVEIRLVPNDRKQLFA